MLKFKRYINNKLYEKKDLQKAEISDEVVYKVLKQVKNRVISKYLDIILNFISCQEHS